MHSARILVAIASIAFMLGASAPAHAQPSQIEPLKAAVKAQPGDAQAALALGRAYRRAGRTLDALAELRRGINVGRGDIGRDLHWELARTHLARGEFGQAMVQCKVLGALPGGAPPGHACAAEAHLSWKRASEALVEIGLAGGMYEAKVAEGEARELESSPKEAEAALRDAIASKPERPEAHLALGRLFVHSAEAQAGGPVPENALRELQEAVRLDPNGPEGLLELATALGVTAEAVPLLERASREREHFAPAERRLAEVELALGHVGQARAAAEAAVKSDPRDAGAHVVYGRVLLAENKPDDAIAAANAALRVVANSAAAKLLVADANAAKGEIDLALEAYQAAYGLDHGDPAPLVRASEACRAAGRYTSARAFGMKATQEFPTWGPGWVALGDALAADHEPADAKTAYERALKSGGPVDAAAVRKKIAQVR